MRRLHLLPRFVATVTVGAGCGSAVSNPDGGLDAGQDAGCVLPSDFPPDASSAEVATVCDCHETPYFHCQVEGGPRCGSWLCFPEKTPDGGYDVQPDGGVVCLC